MKTLNNLFFKLAEMLLVTMLAVMVVMVFGNVVLRYGFNSGIISSEELSRYLFIWITFLGAIIAFRENAHLGLDTVVRLLPSSGKKVFFAVSNVLMFGCCLLMFYGTWKQQGINATTLSPVTETPMSWVYGVGYLTSVAMGLMILGKLVRLARGGFTDDDLIHVQDSEDAAAPQIPGAARCPPLSLWGPCWQPWPWGCP